MKTVNKSLVMGMSIALAAVALSIDAEGAQTEIVFIPPTDCMDTYEREIIAQRFDFYVDEETEEQDGSVTTVYINERGNIIITTSKNGTSCVIGVSK